MIYIDSWSDLQPYGVQALTGEACRVGYRLLADLTPEAARTFRDLYGLALDAFRGNWNGGSGACASVMLPPGCFADVAAWCLLLQARCPRVGIVYGADTYSGFSVFGQGDDSAAEIQLFDSRVETQRETLKRHVRILRLATDQPGEGTRCTHQMSGRTE